ncbi:MAG: hypothetical protein HYX48_07075 [Chlamydiales bacterium]|nr:hypothetical protein [Chlamydiales bacterium]
MVRVRRGEAPREMPSVPSKAELKKEAKSITNIGMKQILEPNAHLDKRVKQATKDLKKREVLYIHKTESHEEKMTSKVLNKTLRSSKRR